MDAGDEGKHAMNLGQDLEQSSRNNCDAGLGSHDSNVAPDSRVGWCLFGATRDHRPLWRLGFHGRVISGDVEQDMKGAVRVFARIRRTPEGWRGRGASSEATGRSEYIP